MHRTFASEVYPVEDRKVYFVARTAGPLTGGSEWGEVEERTRAGRR